MFLGLKENKAEDEATTGDNKYRSLRADHAILLAEARRLDLKAKEVKEEADTRRGEAKEYGEKYRKTKV